MVKLQQTTRLKGFRDILPDDWEYWDYILRIAKEVVQTAGFDRIEIPTLEKASLFNKSVGEETDIVMKEMYVFDTLKMGEKKVTKKEKEDALVALRPELTAGIIRAYIENGMHTMPKPVSFYTIGKCFRHDKPQTGRYREFTQFDVEVLGKSEPIIDANLISVSWGIFEKLKVKDLELHINSIGCSECRPKTKKILTEFLKRKQNKLCEDCKKRLKKNPLRILDCKNEKCQTITASAPIAIDNVCEDCKNHFMAVLEYLDDMEIPYSLTPTLVRGLDYYNRTVFEITSKSEKRQNALGGGGRYDYLIEKMGGDNTPAIGFAIGLDRLVEYMKENNVKVFKQKSKINVYAIHLGEDAKKIVLKLIKDIRKLDISIGMAVSKNSMRAQLKAADKVNALFSIIIGQKEAVTNKVIIRDMRDGVQETVELEDLTSKILEMVEERKSEEEENGKKIKSKMAKQRN